VQGLTAVQISIGDELLSGRTTDTNAALLARALLDLGIKVVERLTVADDRERMLAAFRAAMAAAPIVVASGGLGTTRDDHTRDVLAELAGVPLVESAAIRERLFELARRRGREVHPVWLRQALVPEGAELLANPAGLAPGLWLQIGDTHVCALPGVPREVDAIAAGDLRARLLALPGRQPLAARVLRTVGAAESDVDRVLADVPLAGASLSFLPGPGGLDLLIRASGAGAEACAAAAAARVRARIEQAMGPRIYGDTQETELAAVVLDAFRARGWLLVLAESCTGGWIAKRLTDIPGSSEVLDHAFVVYSNDAKQALLGVEPELLARHGAVSAEVALAMAQGARSAAKTAAGADCVTLAVTGIAGPGGGSPEKPVGLVHLAVDGPLGCRERRLFLPGVRGQIRERTVAIALDLLRRYALAAALD
jgi:nicotinamide-nucleotide amidase